MDIILSVDFFTYIAHGLLSIELRSEIMQKLDVITSEHL